MQYHPCCFLVGIIMIFNNYLVNQAIKQFCHNFCNFHAKIAPKSYSLTTYTTDLHPWLLSLHPYGVIVN